MALSITTAELALGAGDDRGDGVTGTSLTGTTWVLATLAGEAIDSGPAITLRFEDQGTVSGSDGCNRYQGTYVVDGSTIHIPGEIATTRMACPEPVERRTHAYIDALMRAAAFAIDADRLTLQGDTGRELVAFEAQSEGLAGTAWDVIAYNDGKQAVVSVLGGTHLTVRFGEDGRVTGSAGCNQYFAAYAATGESISIGLPGATRKSCAEPVEIMDQEARFLEALLSATSFRREADELTLRTRDGALAVTLVRAADTPSAADPEPQSKIRFDLDRLNKQGLQGPSDGLRALHYEFCVPDRPDAIGTVTAIDPTLEVQRVSPGRIGCETAELLCLGHTHQRDHRAVLERLVALPFVVEIRETFFE